MRALAYRLVRPVLFAVDAEAIHGLTLRTLAIAAASAPGRALCRITSGASADESARDAVELMGLRFRNRVGIGAGFDKDAVALRGWAALGVGFVEVGTITPRPQFGNPRPRLFRLPNDAALINRMGFNNAGAEALARNVAEARPHLPHGFIIGVNIGPNRDGDESDYPAAARTVAAVADYLAINVSSPNTPGLRRLQDPVRLSAIVETVADAAPDRPLLVKLSPDLSDDELGRLLDALDALPLAGLIVSNTTVTRPGLRSRRLAQQAGGLSGRPLLPRTLRTLERVRGCRLTVTASGGIGSGADARAALDAGADLVQLWTGLVYAGPGLIGDAIRAAHARFGAC